MRRNESPDKSIVNDGASPKGANLGDVEEGLESVGILMHEAKDPAKNFDGQLVDGHGPVTFNLEGSQCPKCGLIGLLQRETCGF